MSKRKQPDLGIALNADQLRAEAEIMASIAARRPHVLTGYAGSGKTTLVQVLASKVSSRRTEIVLTAPTHKAVAVLRKKLRAAGIDIQCRTIHSLLGLKAKVYGDRLQFERDPGTPPVTADIVVIDEASMVDSVLLEHIALHLPNSAVLFVGDPAQLPPVGEEASMAFETAHKSHLDTIVRQGAGNPLLDAADCLRAQQGGPIDWSWVKPAMAKPHGVYLPGDKADAWMHKAFTSAEFAADTDRFRYVCWTNKKVAEVNAKVRCWIYGDNLPTPFMPGEKALLRAPVIENDTVLLNTNEETTVKEIVADELEMSIPKLHGLASWRVTIPTWRMSVTSEDGLGVILHMVRDERRYLQAEARIKAEASGERKRWGHFQTFKSRFAKCQGIYATTTHGAQGSTHGNIFLDIPEMRRWSRANLLESQQAAYVAMTRPTHAAILVGAAT